MYTKRNFEEMAAVLASACPETSGDVMVFWAVLSKIVDYFQADNPKFKKDAFVAHLLSRLNPEQLAGLGLAMAASEKKE